MKKVQSTEELQALRHSLAHLLGASLLELYPGTKLAIGPAVEHGFYYDAFVPGGVSQDDLGKIEDTMRRLLGTWSTFSHEVVTAEAARARFEGNPYKLELVDEISSRGESITLYTSGAFTDLCRGGHVNDASTIHPDSFSLSKVAGAYWRGDEKNDQLTRIYGLAFTTPEELQAHKLMLEEAEKRDHRRLGQELELFFFHETAPGMPYWLPKGTTIYNELINFWREEHRQRGYQEIVSPILNKRELYETSGHYEHYWPDMFVAKTKDGEEYGIKAMNCPNAMVVFGSRGRSYRDLPLRLSDTDTLHRNELSGTLNGLLRVREFRQDDAHIFVTEEQVASEYRAVFSIVERFYTIFGLTYSFRLGTRPEKFMGDIETWNQAEAVLQEILNESGKPFVVQDGDGAFYGPKIDILMKDAIGREWQMGTIQLDFQQPRRFNLHYTDASGEKKTPVAIHRVVYGSLERFVGIIIEHFAGSFPVWLSPVQVAVLSVGETHLDACRSLVEMLEAAGIRVALDASGDTVGNKIRRSVAERMPYALVIGDKEAPANGTWDSSTMLSVRVRGSRELLQISLADFRERLRSEIKDRKDLGVDVTKSA